MFVDNYGNEQINDIKLKTKQELTQEEKERYKSLFVNRSDTYLIQLPNGSYARQSAELTDTLLYDNSTISPHLLNTDNKIKYECIDIDVKKEAADSPDFNIEDWTEKLKQQVQNITAVPKKQSIPCYAEFSSRCGYHVWVFFEEPDSI